MRWTRENSLRRRCSGMVDRSTSCCLPALERCAACMFVIVDGPATALAFDGPGASADSSPPLNREPAWSLSADPSRGLGLGAECAYSPESGSMDGSRSSSILFLPLEERCGGRLLGRAVVLRCCCCCCCGAFPLPLSFAFPLSCCCCCCRRRRRSCSAMSSDSVELSDMRNGRDW